MRFIVVVIAFVAAFGSGCLPQYKAHPSEMTVLSNYSLRDEAILYVCEKSVLDMHRKAGTLSGATRVHVGQHCEEMRRKITREQKLYIKDGGKL